MHYHIFDNRAVVKHAYYGADDPEKIHCLKTDRKFPHWEVGAVGLLTRYVRPVLEAGDGPREMVVVHDMGREYRTGMYPDYKQQKSRLDENKSPIEKEQADLALNWAKQFFSALGVVQIGVDKVEADDVIAWLVEGILAAGGTCTIYTVDADLLALCSDSVRVDLKGKPYFGDDAGYEGSDTGAEPVPTRLMTLFKSICGDSSDNYGGVKGMGPAKFHALLNAYGQDGMLELAGIVESGNTDELKAAIDESGDKNLQKLLDNFADWKLSWRLAKLVPELCWKPRRRKLVKPTIHKRVPNAQKVYSLLKDIGATDMWESEYQELLPVTTAITAKNWDQYRDMVFDEIKRSPLTAYDYETSDKTRLPGLRQASARGEEFIDMLSQELTGASFQFGRHLENVIYIPVDHADTENNLPKEVIAEIIHAAQKAGQLVAHNAYFEGVVTKTNLDFWVKNLRDTRVMQRYWDENSEAGLKFMSLEYLGYKQTSYEETLAAGKWWLEHHGEPAKMMCQLTLEETVNYGADDAMVTGYLHDLMQLLLILDRQWNQYVGGSVRPTEVLQRAYVNGVNINWYRQRELHAKDLATIETQTVELRKILAKNVTGEITAGCNAYIMAEKEYILRAARRKLAGGDKVPKAVDEEANRVLFEWRKRAEASCQYVPYRSELVMPNFAFTAKQVSAATTSVGLPAIEKLNHKVWAAYLEDIGAEGFKDSWTIDAAQTTLVEAVSKGLYLTCNDMGKLRKAAEKEAEEKPDVENLADLPKQAALLAAEAFMPQLGEIIQAAAGIKPSIVEFGDKLNVGSQQQMQQLLYCKIGAPVRLRGKQVGIGRLAVGISEAGPATDEQSIQTALELDFKDADCWQHDALNCLLKIKTATTRCGLFHNKYPLWRHVDGRIHPAITQAGTDTRRPTGGSPNVLQVPKKGDGKEVREEFIPPDPDYVTVAIDFASQEIRLMACLADDKVMISVYDPEDEKDLHSMTGSGMLKIAYSEYILALEDKKHPRHKEVKENRSKKAKNVNFGMSYGAGPGTLARNMIVVRDEAKTLLDDTMALYSRIRPWQEETGRFMETYGYTLTAFGTKRKANRDIFSNDSGKVARQHRQGTNATIQGTAAEMLNYVLTQIAESGMMDRLRMEFFAPVYDEVVSFVHKGDVLQYCQEMQVIMSGSTPAGHAIPQVPEFSIGANWGQLHELKRDISPENVAKYVALALEDSKKIWEHDVLQAFDPINKIVKIERDEDDDTDEDEADPYGMAA